ncbi:hypothetical protein RF11_11022 [Thelohanellus kitauei]|uniref:Uncharacterized protein n=1 Tax=Thelohanellus kitauei TaxID=669202 RepID=A0A0C2J7E5_THEKT|nr:hypothetical protein RF11_11022 [Thelohanellus kitauei]
MNLIAKVNMANPQKSVNLPNICAIANVFQRANYVTHSDTSIVHLLNNQLKEMNEKIPLSVEVFFDPDTLIFLFLVIGGLMLTLGYLSKKKSVPISRLLTGFIKGRNINIFNMNLNINIEDK